jgi:hypothetical protein
MKRWYLAAVVVLVLSVGPAAPAQLPKLAVGDLTRVPMTKENWPRTAFSGMDDRLGLTFFDFRPEKEIRRGGYDLDLNLMTLPMLLDWHPFQDSFHVSTGVILNATHARLDAPAAGSAESGTVRGEMQFNPFVPYLGFGWARTFGKDQRWGFMSDFGVAFLGTPEVSLRAAGPLASDPAFRRGLAEEQSRIEDDMSDFRFYPIISISLYYRF